MHITLQPTSAWLKVEADTLTQTLNARVWVGELDDGSVVQALIFNVAIPGHRDPHGVALRLAHEVQPPPQKIVWVDDQTAMIGGQEIEL